MTEIFDETVRIEEINENAESLKDTAFAAPEKHKPKIILDASKPKHEKREPFARIAKKENTSFIQSMVIRVIAVFASLLVILIFLSSVTHASFGKIWNLMWEGIAASSGSTNLFLINTACLLGISLALAPAFKMKFWNIGAQGQVLIGALFAAIVMFYLGDSMSSSTAIFVMFLLCVIAGGVWAFIPAFFKVKINANETLFTLMMNYVALQIVKGCVTIWQGGRAGLGYINMESHFGYFPDLFNNPYGLSILIISLIAAIMYVYMRKSKQGYEISVVGESLNTARYAGINTKKVILRTMFLSGAICGIVGMIYVAGVGHTISTSTGGNYGFTAIIVAWAAKFNPIAMVAISLIIVFLERGSAGVCNNFVDLNSYTGYIVVGIFLFFLIGCEFFINYKLVPNSKIAASIEKTRTSVRKKLPKLVALWDSFSEKISYINALIHNFIDKTKRAFNFAVSRAGNKAAVFFRKIKIKVKSKGKHSDQYVPEEIAVVKDKENSNKNLNDNELDEKIENGEAEQ